MPINSCIRGFQCRGEVRGLEESTCRKIKKSLHFEKGGETFSVELGLENVSPDISKRRLRDHLSLLYKEVLAEIIGYPEDSSKARRV